MAVLPEMHKVVITEAVPDNNGPAPVLNPGGLVRVGLGHLLNLSASKFLKNYSKFSDMSGFGYALSTDLSKISKEKLGKLAFYVETDSAGKAECFAECFAALNGGGAVYTLDVMGKYFPAVMKQIKDVISEVKDGVKHLDTSDEKENEETSAESEPPTPAPAPEPQATPAPNMPGEA
jgi:hypothetical protein